MSSMNGSLAQVAMSRGCMNTASIFHAYFTIICSSASLLQAMPQQKAIEKSIYAVHAGKELVHQMIALISFTSISEEKI